jgi:hypothetical protein
MQYPGPDDELYWREEAFGEHPILSPWGDLHHLPRKEEEAEECSISS